MKLYYFAHSRNFGDDLNTWLWPRLLPGCWDPDDGVCFSGIGTILNAAMPRADRWVVFSSGVGYGGRPDVMGGGNWQVLAVRGPLSAAVLGLPSDVAVTDGAMLLASLPELAPLPEGEREGTIFVPHFEAAKDAAWPEACRRVGLEFLDPLADSRTVVERIRRARLVVAEAMHAAIVADVLRVPFVPVVSSPQVSTFKWLDWTLSMDLPYRPRPLRASSMRSGLRNRMLWAYRQTHHFRGRGRESALAYYRHRYDQAPSPLRGQINMLGRRIHRRLDRIIDMPWLGSWRAAHEAAALDRAASDLERAAATPGFLSDDRVHAARLQTLITRLERLAKAPICVVPSSGLGYMRGV